jgi:hypothetical protein
MGFREEPHMLRVTAAVLCLLCSAAETAASPNLPRLRPAAPASNRLIARAIRDSAIVRALAAEIAASDLIVYVEIGPVDSHARATTEFVTATAHARFVRITLPALTPPTDLIPLLAHELQHAVEIAREPAVRDAASLRAHYARIGIDPAAAHGFETLQARVIERDVRREARRRPR